jgi:DNA-binding response OmpR family regulator
LPRGKRRQVDKRALSLKPIRMRVLVVEDEVKVARLIRKALKEQGFQVDLCADGAEAFETLCGASYDAAVLDIMLPGCDGLSVVRRLRDRKITVPVMLVSARGETCERVEGLNVGADDYLPKPFSTDELVARLRALLRRSAGSGLSVYQIDNLTLNLLTREVRRGARKIELSAREFALLEYLMRTPGRVLTRTQICEAVWDYHFDPGTNIVDVYIQRLRRKIDGEEPERLLQTVRGVGYTMRVE